VRHTFTPHSRTIRQPELALLNVSRRLTEINVEPLSFKPRNRSTNVTPQTTSDGS
jgi:hypothetical protein